MRNRAGGLLIENGKILLIHKIKNINGERKEYYVVPGGGIEEKENIKGTCCEVYSRVVGYLRPVQSYNKGKKEEYFKRKCYKV